MASTQRVIAETFLISASDPGIELYVGNKRLEGRDAFPAERTVLFVHGATYPSEVGFDLDLPGGSWAENLARAGYDVYYADVRGYGRSTRPAAMAAAAADNPPFATTADAIRDVGVAIDFILARRSISKLNLVGWSWGTTIMGGYTTVHNQRVNKLVLYAPLWHLKTPPPVAGSGAYRTVTRVAARARSMQGIPPRRVEEISPEAWFDIWWQACLESDPAGARADPPVVRAPNGVVQDLDAYWGAGKATWDPGGVRVPTLVIGAEWDQDAPPYMAEAVYAALVNSPGRSRVVIGEGTHTVALEKNRTHLMQAVQTFLEAWP